MTVQDPRLAEIRALLPERSPNTLYRRLRLEGALAGLVDAFYAKNLSDPRVSHLFAHLDATGFGTLKWHLRIILAAVLDDRLDLLGNYDLTVAHANVPITNEVWDIVIGDHLVTTILEAGVPASEVEGLAPTVESLRPVIVNTAA